jgi:alpha/beta hydrolase fold
VLRNRTVRSTWRTVGSVDDTPGPLTPGADGGAEDVPSNLQTACDPLYSVDVGIDAAAGASRVGAMRRGGPEMTATMYRTVDVDGVNVFYREAGSPDAPAVLLLHGYPSSSHQFRDLMPMLVDRFHVVAPDMPGFGQTDMPSREKFTYTFKNLAHVIDRFTEVIRLDGFAMYVFDYGAPVGFRIATQHPERVRAVHDGCAGRGVGVARRLYAG